MNNTAIIILHEIYGLNEHMKYQSDKYTRLGYDVITPNMLEREKFTYEQVEEAYSYFNENVGFDSYRKITDIVHQLKKTYSKVYIIGFSVGATLAWRCSNDIACDGIIACYGSRIRDYLEINPCCPVLLIFAKEDSFQVTKVADTLTCKDNVKVHIYDAGHGFMDPYSKSYNAIKSKEAELRIINFLKSI